MRGREAQALSDRVGAIADLLDQVHRSMERIELVTVIREPNTGMSADAYNGLRKQVIGAMSERMAHLHQLAQFDASLRAGATSEELSALAREWLGQSSLDTIEDLTHEEAFELVGPETATGRRILRPAYVDRLTGRVVRAGIAERVDIEEGIEEQPLDASEAPPSLDGTNHGEAPGDQPSLDGADHGEVPPSAEEPLNTPGGAQ
jgi:hypothetical protein